MEEEIIRDREMVSVMVCSRVEEMVIVNVASLVCVGDGCLVTVVV